MLKNKQMKLNEPQWYMKKEMGRKPVGPAGEDRVERRVERDK